MNNLSPQKILIAIPSYNCEDQIQRVLQEIDKKLFDRVAEIAVIDNGSTDGTVKKALDYKKTNKLDGKLHIYQNVDNFNLGGTHKVAFQKATKEGFTHVVILHGDNQAKSTEANDLIDFMEANPQHQTVLGSRFNKQSTLIGYDKKRIYGNKVLNAIYSIGTFKKLQDLGSGLNLFALSDLDPKTYIQFADKLTFNFELILDLVKRKVNFAYLPITWREDDQVTNARNFNIFKTALVNLADWRFRPTPNATKKASTYKCKEIL
jgi:glycosyltransferase involved in cell wall biosynthesis